MDGYTLEDGTSATEGDRVFNYYDREPVTIGADDGEGWFDTIRDDGTRGKLLDGSRCCSIETATRKRWMV